MPRVFLHYKGEYVHLPDGATVVGREADCRLRFNDPSVSRRHFEITVAEDGVVLTDLGSTNGTRVNGRRIGKSVSLSHRDTIQIGVRKLTVYFLDDRDGEGDGDVEFAPEVSTLVEATLVSSIVEPGGAGDYPELGVTQDVPARRACPSCGRTLDPRTGECRACTGR